LRCRQERATIEYYERLTEIENLYMLDMFASEEEYRRAKEMAELQHQARMGDIFATAKLKQMQFEKKTYIQQKKELFSFMAEQTAGVAQHNRLMFEINKAAAIGTAVVNVATGITEALKFGPILGPPLAALVAAAAKRHRQLVRRREAEPAHR